MGFSGAGKWFPDVPQLLESQAPGEIRKIISGPTLPGEFGVCLDEIFVEFICRNFLLNEVLEFLLGERIFTVEFKLPVGNIARSDIEFAKLSVTLSLVSRCVIWHLPEKEFRPTRQP